MRGDLSHSRSLSHMFCCTSHALKHTYSHPPTPLPLTQELILFSRTDLERSIPSVMDGLKPGQRKILFSCFKKKLYKEEVKVGMRYVFAEKGRVAVIEWEGSRKAPSLARPLSSFLSLSPPPTHTHTHTHSHTPHALRWATWPATSPTMPPTTTERPPWR
jgi:hypothetical protein